MVIDDYFGPAKAAPFRVQVDALVSEGWLVSFGNCGWAPGLTSGSGNDFGYRVPAGPALPHGSKPFCALSDKKR